MVASLSWFFMQSYPPKNRQLRPFGRSSQIQLPSRPIVVRGSWMRVLPRLKVLLFVLAQARPSFRDGFKVGGHALDVGHCVILCTRAAASSRRSCGIFRPHPSHRPCERLTCRLIAARSCRSAERHSSEQNLTLALFVRRSWSTSSPHITQKRINCNSIGRLL